MVLDFSSILLAVIAVCAVVMTVLFLTTYTGILRVLQQLQEILPTCQKTFQEAQGALHESRQILSRANQATHAVEKVVKKAVSFIGNRFAVKNGNGTGHLSRRHYR